ncbi:hypothetical protein BDV95DRAFT_573352 [Massariosphaeria phaeospora]|uniref:NAD(P)-binding protein n=1 Tax=Massariosphaeria phaeospora TaxID=100035 RepID=A0A7C8I574_9PLEO|nr:hypothetical protein BDV95DRAFT_573352 [Massariosphaeria phaeospora]
MSSPDPDQWVKSQQFTRSTHRDVYPAVDPAQPSLSQKGKVVVITGASQGIGSRGFVPAFAAAGAKAIVLVARNADKLAAVADSVTKNYPNVEVLSVPTDITDPAAVAALFEKVKSKYGHADVLVNNAGGFNALGPAKDVAINDWWKDMEVNVYGPLLVTQGFLKLLPSAETPAKIISLTSGAAVEVLPGMSAYSISKQAGLNLITYVAAENPNVFAVSLHPGVVLTDMVFEAFQVFAKDTPELVGGVGTWLASWEADRSFLAGRYMNVNWDVEELEGRKEEIEKGNLLKIGLRGKFGLEQFA